MIESLRLVEIVASKSPQTGVLYSQCNHAKDAI